MPFPAMIELSSRSDDRIIGGDWNDLNRDKSGRQPKSTHFSLCKSNYFKRERLVYISIIQYNVRTPHHAVRIFFFRLREKKNRPVEQLPSRWTSHNNKKKT